MNYITYIEILIVENSIQLFSNNSENYKNVILFSLFLFLYLIFSCIFDILLKCHFYLYIHTTHKLLLLALKFTKKRYSIKH